MCVCVYYWKEKGKRTYWKHEAGIKSNSSNRKQPKILSIKLQLLK